MTRWDLEALLEHEQDRGLKAASVKSHLGLVKALVRFLIDREVVRARNITIQLPELLPRAMDPEDSLLYYQCFHNSCKGRKWTEARQVISGAAQLGEFISGHSGGYAPGGGKAQGHPEKEANPGRQSMSGGELHVRLCLRSPPGDCREQRYCAMLPGDPARHSGGAMPKGLQHPLRFRRWLSPGGCGSAIPPRRG